MLVPVQGGVANLQKRNRTIHDQIAVLATVVIPSVYIFNVGPREWKGSGGGKDWKIPACPKGQRYSEPVAIPMLCLSERDLADGGNNMDTVTDAGISGTRKVAGELKHVIGVANDIIGMNSTSPGLGLYTTNGEWFGLFVTTHKIPTEDELDAADGKLREMAQLIYHTGSEKVQAGEKVSISDRPLYNWSAAHLGAKALWGNLDHTMAVCPECQEDIREGATFCKHCNQAIDPASVQARAKKREREAARLLKDEETA